MRGDGPSTSPFGYKTISVEPGSSYGIYFKLAEGEVSQRLNMPASADPRPTVPRI